MIRPFGDMDSLRHLWMIHFRLITKQVSIIIITLHLQQTFPTYLADKGLHRMRQIRYFLLTV